MTDVVVTQTLAARYIQALIGCHPPATVRVVASPSHVPLPPGSLAGGGAFGPPCQLERCSGSVSPAPVREGMQSAFQEITGEGPEGGTYGFDVGRFLKI